MAITEKFVLAPRATLASAITSTSTSLTLLADKGWPTSPDERFRVLIDNEVIVLLGSSSLTYNVAMIPSSTGGANVVLGRGAEGTTAAGHNAYAAAAVILTPDGLSGLIEDAIGEEDNPNGGLFLIWQFLKRLNAS